MKPNRFDWQRVPGVRSVRDIAESAKRKGINHHFCGSVLYVLNPKGLWLQFMRWDNWTVYRVVPGQHRPRVVVPGPAFTCESCSRTLPLEKWARTVQADLGAYDICKDCEEEEVVRKLKENGVRLRDSS